MLAMFLVEVIRDYGSGSGANRVRNSENWDREFILIV